MNDTKHVLGFVGDLFSTIRASAFDYVKFGAGGAAAVLASEYLISKVLVKNGTPIVPANWAPAAIALFGIVGGELTKQKVDRELGEGMIVGGMTLAMSALAARFISPTVAASASSASAAEAQGAGTQPVAGFGFGRAFALGAGVGPSMYGVGTPDMRAAGMFNGATLAIEEVGSGGGFAGATVAIEEQPNFAGTLN